MRNPVQEDQFSEISIDADHDSPLKLGSIEQRAVAGIRPQVAGLKNIVPPRSQPFRKCSSRTLIDQEFH